MSKELQEVAQKAEALQAEANELRERANQLHREAAAIRRELTEMWAVIQDADQTRKDTAYARSS